MRPSWNEIRTRAATFAQYWKGRGYERGETQTFYNEFFEVFGVPRKKVAIFEQPIKNLPESKRGFIDLFWKGVLLVEQKSAGLNLAEAKKQAFNYLPGIKSDDDLPRFILLCDFQSFELYDLETRKDWKFGLYDLPKWVQIFSFIFGGVQREFKEEDKVNIKASELMGELHDALKASGYVGHDLERFLVRLVFCLFADDTGIFAPRGILTDYLETRTSADGADIGPKLSQLFDVLNTPGERRQKALDEDLSQFPYINGDLFNQNLRLPAFNGRMRKLLLEACAFDWSEISPAIFGSLFQFVIDPKKRREQGTHYTNEQCILKVIGPLFLDDLKAELAHLKTRKDTGREKALLAFQDKLAGIKCFDPACGCGNFLVIAYRELRALETEVILDLTKIKHLFTEQLSKVDVNQFYGIEIEEFAARIAETALWMMDHIMNQRLSDKLGEVKLRIPLKATPTIVQTDALEIDWMTVLPPKQCTYVFGNPPFFGSKKQTDQQRAQVHRIANLDKKKGTLDYVTCWFLKAGSYVQSGNANVGFVATNSITQGEQVAELWPLLFERYNFEIAYAHRTFAWESEARGKAHVHVVIIGLTKRENVPASKRLFDYANINGNPTETKVKVISPYLFDAGNLSDPHTVVFERATPITDRPKMIIGSKPIDGGYLILDDQERGEFLADEPLASQYIRPFIGGVEYIQGRSRWILALQEASPEQLRRMPRVLERLDAVRKYRLGKIPARKKEGEEPKMPGISARSLAQRPTQFHVTVIPRAPFLAVPENSSETRPYVPIGWLEPPIVPSNKLRFARDATLFDFGILTSRMHVSWLRFIGGKIKSDFQYSIGIVYNAFPWPEVDAPREKIGKLAEAVLAARRNYPQSTLADLYDPITMPPDLRKAHTALDLAVDRLYRKEPFETDRARVEFLLARYELIIAPALALAARKPKRAARKSRA